MQKLYHLNNKYNKQIRGWRVVLSFPSPPEYVENDCGGSYWGSDPDIIKPGYTTWVVFILGMFNGSVVILPGRLSNNLHNNTP